MADKKTLYRLSGYIYLLPYLILFTGFLLIPLIYGLGLSFYRWEIISSAPPEFIWLGNFKEALTSAYFWKAFFATFRFVIMTVPCLVILSLLIACGINSISRGRESFYRAAYFLPTLISISVAGILWRWFYNSEFGLFNSILMNVGVKLPWITEVSWAMKSIVMMTLWWTVGGPVVIFLAGLKSIPDHYYEAAAIDGAEKWHRFRHITLPLLKPVLLFVVIMNIIGSFQIFGQTYMITGGGPEQSTRVLVQYIYETAFMHYRMGYSAAMSWLLFAAIAVFSFIQFYMMRER